MSASETHAPSGFSHEPLVLVALRDGPHSRRLAVNLRHWGISFIQVASLIDAVHVRRAVGKQIVGLVTEIPREVTVEDADCLALIGQTGVEVERLPTLLIGENLEHLERLKAQLAPGSDYLMKPFSDYAWASRLEAFRDFVRVGRLVPSIPVLRKRVFWA